MQLDLFATEADEKIHETFIKDLKRGSGFENGKTRIYDFFNQKLTKAESIELLKNEYGIGGRSLPNGGFQRHDSSGISIRLGTGEEKLYTWSQVYDALFNLIESGKYMEK